MADIFAGSTSSGGGESAPATTSAPATGGTQQGSTADSGSTETSGATSGETTTETTAAPAEQQATEQPAAAAPGQPDEFTTYATAKGYSPDDLKHETVKRAITAQREMEKHMGRVQSEYDRLKRESLARAAEIVEAANAPAKSPLQEFEDQIAAEVGFQCEIYGCANEQELAIKAPQAYQHLQRVYNARSKELQQKEIDWHFSQRDRKSNAETEKQRLEQEYAGVREQAKEVLSNYRSKDREFDSLMIKSGSAEQISRLSDITKIPIDYFHADKKFMGWLAPLLEAHNLVSSGKLQKDTKQEIEKAIKKAKSAEMPGGTPLPDDHEALMFHRAQKRGQPKSIFD
jgi:hypothetical protein